MKKKLSTFVDSFYRLEPYLLAAVANPGSPGKKLYNRRHPGMRVIVEEYFGVHKSSFHCLHKPGGALQYLPVKCAKITIEYLLLLNYFVNCDAPDSCADRGTRR